MMIKRLKILYEFYNFFHRKELFHNRFLYKKYGINKHYFSSISSKDFESVEAPLPKRQKSLNDIALYRELNSESKQSIENFDEEGYCVLKNYLTNEQVNKINGEIENLLETGKIKYRYRNKLMFVIHESEYLRRISKNENLKELLDYLIRGDALLFQSINFLSGSEQKTHSDSIHMTTFPQGGLLGVWIALEDINDDNGPLHYYPGSHKLPYYLNRDYGNEGNRFFLGRNDYTVYENMIEKKIEENKLKKRVFKAKKGDVLIWHANLFHGGEPHINKDKSRKSMVLHFFDANRILYHEITQRPALLKNFDQSVKP